LRKRKRHWTNYSRSKTTINKQKGKLKKEHKECTIHNKFSKVFKIKSEINHKKKWRINAIPQL